MPAPDRPPSFPCYPRDFLGDRHVRAMLQMPWPHGFVAAWGYTSIWMSSWEEPEPGVLPDDDVVLASLAGIPIRRWPKYREVIARCFDTTSRPGCWIQKRVVRERQLMVERKMKAIESGREGGRKSVEIRRGRATVPSRHPQGSGDQTGYPPAVASAFAVASAVEESKPTHRPGGGSPSAQNGHSPNTPVAEWDEGFDADFWPQYPRQVRRSEALAAWRTLKPWTQGHLDAICAGLKRWQSYWDSRGTPPDKIPYPAAFLRGRQHEDQPL